MDVLQREKRANDSEGLVVRHLLPTKVVLLKNMVGPGQVDDDLDSGARWRLVLLASLRAGAIVKPQACYVQERAEGASCRLYGLD